MSISLLQELHDELSDILLAGNNSINENLKLQQLLPALDEFGKQVSVFAKIANLLKQVIALTDETPRLLLEILTLINSVLTTQAMTGKVGELDTPILCNLNEKELSYQRLEQIKNRFKDRINSNENLFEAFAKGELQDLRLISFLIYNRDNSFFHLIEKLFLRYGKTLIPFLQRKFNLQGGWVEQRKLYLIVKLDQGGLQEFYLQILQDSENIDFKFLALLGLKNYPETLELLLKYSNAPEERLQLAALEALSYHQGELVEEILFKTLLETELDKVAEFCQNFQFIKFVTRVLEEAEKILGELLQTDLEPEKLAEKCKKLSYLIRALRKKRTPALYQFYQSCFREHQVTFSSDYSPGSQAAINLLFLDDPEACQLLIESLQKFGEKFLGYAFDAALRYKTPDYVCDNFLHYLTGECQEDRDKIMSKLSNYTYSKKDQIKLDGRWLEPLIKLNKIDVVKEAIRPEDQRAIKCLVSKFDELLNDCEDNYNNNKLKYEILEVLVKVNYVGIWNEFQKLFKSNNWCWVNYGIAVESMELVTRLPASYADQIYDYGRKNNIYEVILAAKALREKNK